MRNLLVLAAVVAIIASGTASPYQNDQTELRRKEHSKLKGDYSVTGIYIPNLLTKSGRDITIVKHHAAGYTGQPANIAPYPSYELIANGCTSNAVVTGTVGSQSSDVTEDGHFLYTDLQFTVTDILKNNANNAIAVGETITITRPGGAITAHGRTIRAIDPGFKEFRSGGSYLLYLQYIPVTKDYRATAEGSYEIDGNRAIPISGSSSVHANSSVELLEEAKSALNTSCGGER